MTVEIQARLKYVGRFSKKKKKTTKKGKGSQEAQICDRQVRWVSTWGLGFQ
jgi:hypothetical protein